MNVKRLFSKVGDGLSRVVVRVEETDPVGVGGGELVVSVTGDAAGWVKWW